MQQIAHTTQELRKQQKQNITKSITIIQNAQTEIYSTWHNKQVIELLEKALKELYIDYGLITHMDNNMKTQIQNKIDQL